MVSVTTGGNCKTLDGNMGFPSLLNQDCLTIFYAKRIPSLLVSVCWLSEKHSLMTKTLQVTSDTGNANLVLTGTIACHSQRGATVICMACLFPSMRIHPAVIKRSHTLSSGLIYPSPPEFTLTLRSPSPPSCHSFIYLCYLAPLLALSLCIFYSTMVSTRLKNKTSHPAAPVMTTAAKKKARSR